MKTFFQVIAIVLLCFNVNLVFSQGLKTSNKARKIATQGRPCQTPSGVLYDPPSKSWIVKADCGQESTTAIDAGGYQDAVSLVKAIQAQRAIPEFREFRDRESKLISIWVKDEE